jgi:hypothetical protein
MRILTTASGINNELVRLIRECSSCQIAVAWASVGFEAFHLLAKDHQKIRRMVVGTHFYQTHPQFIEMFLTNPSVRFVLNPDGVFHRKRPVRGRLASAGTMVAFSPTRKSNR